MVSPTEVELEDTLDTEGMMGTVSEGPAYRGGQDRTGGQLKRAEVIIN